VSGLVACDAVYFE